MNTAAATEASSRAIAVRLFCAETKAFIGTGTLLNNRWAATCAHVVGERRAVLFATPADQANQAGLLAEASLANLGVSYVRMGRAVYALRTADVVQTEPSFVERDLALLRLDSPVGRLDPLDRMSDLGWEDGLYAFGYPNGGNFPEGLGFTSRLRSWKTAIADAAFPELTVFHIDGRSRPGMSGGPVTALRRHALVGLLRGYDLDAGLPILDKDAKRPIGHVTDSLGCQVLPINGVDAAARDVGDDPARGLGPLLREAFVEPLKHDWPTWGLLAAVLMALVNAAGFILSKWVANAGLSLGLNAGGAVLVGGVICVLVALAVPGPSNDEYAVWAGPSGRLRHLAWMLVPNAGQFALVIGSLYYLSPTEARALVASSPIIATVVHYAAFRRLFAGYRASSVVLFVAGLLLLFWRDQAEHRTSPVGIVLALSGAVMWLIYGLIANRLRGSGGSIGARETLLRLGLLNIASGILLLVLLLGPAFTMPAGMSTTELWAVVANGARIAIVYAMHQYVIRHIHSVLADFIAGLGVLFVLALDAALLGTQVTPYHVIGCVLLVLGLQFVRADSTSVHGTRT